MVKKVTTSAALWSNIGPIMFICALIFNAYIFVMLYEDKTIIRVDHIRSTVEIETVGLFKKGKRVINISSFRNIGVSQGESLKVKKY